MPIGDLSAPADFGEDCDGSVFGIAEWLLLQVTGPDGQNVFAVMDAKAKIDDPRDRFAHTV